MTRTAASDPTDAGSHQTVRDAAPVRVVLRDLVWRAMSIVWLPLFVPLALVAVPVARVLTAARRRARRRPRILRAAYALPDTIYKVEADRRRGYTSRLLVWQPSYYNRAGEVPWLIRRHHKLLRTLVLPRYAGFLWSLFAGDVFQYYLDEQQLHDTVLERWEIPLLKAAGKSVVLFPYGSDVMVPGMRAYGGLDFYDLVVKDYPIMGTARWRRRVRRRLAVATRYADCVISCVPYVDVMPSCRLKRHYVAIDEDEWPAAEPPPETGTVLIAHASNHPHNKGSDRIEAVCRQLVRDGHPVEFVLLTRVAREEAQRVYARAGIIVEQILAGNIGMFGVEAMAMGKPVVAYLRDDILDHHPWMAECPIVNANPETLGDVLTALVHDPERRVRVGRAGREYVRKYHALDAIGAFSEGVYRSVWPHGPDGAAAP